MRSSSWLALLASLSALTLSGGCGSPERCEGDACAPPAAECARDADCTSPPTACHLSPGICDAGTCTYEDSGPTATYCLDADGDGYCTETCAELCAGSASPEGYRSDCAPELDCNDADAGVNPGAAEICDGQVDENCNAAVDEGCGCTEVTFCEDRDGDGHCTASCVTACESAAPAGHRRATACVSQLDCNDADPAVRPGTQCTPGTTRPCSVCDRTGTQACSSSCTWEPLCRNVDRWGHWYGTDPAISHYFEGPPANGDVCGFPWNDPRGGSWCRENAWCIDNSWLSPDADRNCFALYGPYLRLPPGDYEVRFDVYYKGIGFIDTRVKARYDVWDGVQRLASMDYDVPATLDVTLHATTLPFTILANGSGVPACRPIEFRAFLVDASSAQYHQISLRPIGTSDYPIPPQ